MRIWAALGEMFRIVDASAAAYMRRSLLLQSSTITCEVFPGRTYREIQYGDNQDELLIARLVELLNGIYDGDDDDPSPYIIKKE